MTAIRLAPPTRRERRKKPEYQSCAGADRHTAEQLRLLLAPSLDEPVGGVFDVASRIRAMNSSRESPGGSGSRNSTTSVPG